MHKVDIEDNDKNYVITANVPGIDEKNIDIRVIIMSI